TNAPAGMAFGNEADSACDLACKSGNLAACCDATTYPAGIDVPFGAMRLDAQVAQSYAFGPTYVDLANWANFYRAAFDECSTSLATAAMLGAQPPTMATTCNTQALSLAQLYTHHDDAAYINQQIATHTMLGGDTCPIAVTVTNDL